MFDAKKLEWMNGVYLRALPTFDLAERLIAYLAERGSPLASQPARVIEVTSLAQEKIATLAEFEPLCSFLFGPVEIDPEAWERGAGTSGRPRSWPRCRRRSRTASGHASAIEATLRAVCEQLALKPRVHLRPGARGRHGQLASRPACSRASHLLGRDEALARLSAAAPASASSGDRRCAARPGPPARGRRPRTRGPRAMRACRARPGDRAAGVRARAPGRSR